MQSMFSIRTDAHLWIGLAILGWCSALAVHKQLKIIRALSEVIEKIPSPSTRVNRQTQEAIKIASLSQLLQSPNSEIRDASIKIVAERALQSPTVWLLLRRQVRSTTHREARNQALCVLVYFGPGSVYDQRMRHGEPGSIEYDEFFHPATFNAVVTCLFNMLPAAREAERSVQHHDSAEADALWLAHKLLNHNSDLALKTGLVSKWLVNYPLNLRDPNRTKQNVIRDMTMDYEWVDDYERLLCCLLFDLTENAKARKEMARYDLIDQECPNVLPKLRIGQNWGVRQQHHNPDDLDRRPELSEPERDIGEAQDVAAAMMSQARTMDAGHDAGAHNASANQSANQNYSTQPGVRVFEQSAPFVLDELNLRRREGNVEQRALRSRRREAMVLAEPGRPMRREDIIESRRETHPEDLMEAETERSIEEDREETYLPASQETRRQQMTWFELLVRLRPDGSLRM